MKLTAIATLVLFGTTGIAGADAPGDCPHTTRPPKRPRPPRRPPPPTPPTKCDCVGMPGPQGPKGDRGETIVVSYTVEVPARPTVRLALGTMGTHQFPHGDWAWGPALQLATDITPEYEFAFSTGLAAGASDGRETGHLFELKLTRNIGDGVGLFGGLHLTSIDGSQDNGDIDGSYLNVTAGLSYTGSRVKLAFGPTIGGLRDTNEPGTQFVGGFQASAFVRIGK